MAPAASADLAPIQCSKRGKILLSLPTAFRSNPDLGIAVLARTRRACHAIEQGESISAHFSASKSVEVRPLGSLIRAFSGCSKAAARGAAVLRNAGVASCCVAGCVRHADFWLAGISSRPKGSGTSTAAIKTACWLQCSCHDGYAHRTALEAIFTTLLCSIQPRARRWSEMKIVLGTLSTGHAIAP